MAQFVKHHQDGQTQQQLGSFDQRNHGANVHPRPRLFEEFTQLCSQRIETFFVQGSVRRILDP